MLHTVMCHREKAGVKLLGVEHPFRKLFWDSVTGRIGSKGHEKQNEVYELKTLTPFVFQCTIP